MTILGIISNYRFYNPVPRVSLLPFSQCEREGEKWEKRPWERGCVVLNFLSLLYVGGIVVLRSCKRFASGAYHLIGS